MNVLDLFSGIGGFSLGLERAGMRTVAFCEIDPYARAVLRKHWPDVPCYDDVRTLSAARLAADGIGVDVICGGFPCQDISLAGAGAGLDGERSGLWREVARLVGELRPQYVILENVAALLSRGLGRVLGDLAEIGYDAEWHCIPASHVGANHRRDRWWAVAYPNGIDWRAERRPDEQPREARRQPASDSGQDVADTDGQGLERLRPERSVSWGSLADGYARQGRASDRWGWAVEPQLGRVAHGIPNRAHRLRCLGNAVVPAIPEIIGRAIMRATNEADLSLKK